MGFNLLSQRTLLHEGEKWPVLKSHSWVRSDHYNSQVPCSVLLPPHHILMQLYQYFQWEKVSVFLSNQVANEPL